jgi:hypothetical protein
VAIPEMLLYSIPALLAMLGHWEFLGIVGLKIIYKIVE